MNKQLLNEKINKWQSIMDGFDVEISTLKKGDNSRHLSLVIKRGMVESYLNELKEMT